MAAFGNSPYDNSITTNVRVLVYFQYVDAYIPFFDYSGFDSSIKEFKRFAHRAKAQHTFCGRSRARAIGHDYKTPIGERPFWVKPEAPEGELPSGAVLPRWREYARRHV